MKTSPAFNAGFISQLLFLWVNKILRLGSKRQLELDDLYGVLPEHESKELGNKLEIAWFKQLASCRHKNSKVSNYGSTDPLVSNGNPTQKHPSLFKVLLSVFGMQYLILGFPSLINQCVIKVIQPVFLGYLIRYSIGQSDVSAKYLFGTGVILCSIWYISTHHANYMRIQHFSMKMRLAVCSLVYRKALRISLNAFRETTVGQIVNLLSRPLQLIIATYVLWWYFYYYCLIGVGFLILFIPFQRVMGRLFGKLRTEVAAKTDKRIRIMDEIIGAIRVIKMYTWEIPFSKFVNEARKDEIKSLKSVAILKTINNTMQNVSSKFVVYITLLSYILTGNVIHSEAIFVTLSLYNNIRLTLTMFFPLGISALAELLAGIKRIEKFLLLEEKEEKIPTLKTEFRKNGLNLKYVCASWNPNDKHLTLKDVNLNVKEKELVAVIGSVGSSKSSLLQLILGELPILSGRMDIEGSLAYTSQEPWIFSGTIRENIFFGSQLNEDWYNAVLDACALKDDLMHLPRADESLVGDRGISLSGGQKARVALARAVYADRDIYLLDDPFAAVDSEVGKHLWEKCIKGLLKNKIVILTTHQVQLVNEADQIMLLNNGRVDFIGNYQDLLSSGIPSFTSMSRRQSRAFSHVEIDAFKKLKELSPMESSTDSFDDETEQSKAFMTTIIPKMKSSTEKVGPEEESRKTEVIKFSLYLKFMKAGSKWFSFTMLLISSIVTQLCLSGADYLLLYIAEDYHARQNTTTDFEPNSTSNAIVSLGFEGNWPYYPQRPSSSSMGWFRFEGNENLQIIVYSLVIILLFVFSFVRSFIFLFMCLRSSIVLHNDIFLGVIRSPMKFFESNPRGRILNRFAKDIGVIDELIPLTLFDTYDAPYETLGVLIVISIINPISVIPALILLWSSYSIRKFYLKTGRSLKRLESITRSPIFTHLSSTFYGLPTIRALNAQTEFVIKFDKLQNAHSSCWYLLLGTARWVALVLEWVAVGYIAIVTYSLLISDLYGSRIGLSVASALALTGLFQWGIRQSTETENNMVSVERVFEYSALKPEASPESMPEYKPNSRWPEKGEIIFNNLVLKYNENDEHVLKSISLKIQSNEKIGIVGRTGSGKTSLISVLFRLVEPVDGSVTIDGLNIAKLGLRDLRSKISIIPQDPVLFLGTIRRNLDPFQEFSDVYIWKALEDVQLKEIIQNLPAALDTYISEGGSNFSVGERQLLCLARAIIRKNRILVLDEATANIDHRTDTLIQLTIRDKFQDCTVLTVAHRLNTVMDSDRILVLHAGEIKEFDSPYNLLQNKDSMLYSMAEQTGASSLSTLIRISKKTFLAKES